MLLYKFIQKRAWYLVSAIYTIIVLCYCNTPVFWDMYGQVKTAHYFLETNFKDLLSNNSRIPLYAFLIAQLFNVIVTLIIAFLLSHSVISGTVCKSSQMC